ncbi:uncharacterized protein spz isoform X2 [Prorops nasuta]|uniref:uncharacterized protein spz isoform X2 n=1 Tax=Prorops nasuta TaxID=863751 RepID=UPI0034CF42AB
MLLRKRHRNILVFRISLLFLVVQECRGRPYDFWYGWPGPVPMPFDMSNQPMWPMVPQHKTNQKQTPVNNRAEKNFNNNRPSGVASSSSSLTPSSSSNSKHEKKNKIVSHAISRDYVNTMIDDVYGTRNPIPKDYEKNNDENLYKNTMEKPKTAPKQTTKIVTESPKEDTMSLDEKIFFPDDQPITHQSSLKKAPECNGKTYCEDAAFYPAEVVKTAVRMDNSLQNLATIDITEVVQRIDVSDDVPLCLSIEQVVYPRSAESRRKEWLYVVNQDNFRQGVRIETCLFSHFELFL